MWQNMLCNLRSGITKDVFSTMIGKIWRMRSPRAEDSSELNYSQPSDPKSTRSFRISTIVDAVASEARLYVKTWLSPFTEMSCAFEDTFSLFKQSINGVT